MWRWSRCFRELQVFQELQEREQDRGRGRGCRRGPEAGPRGRRMNAFSVQSLAVFQACKGASKLRRRSANSRRLAGLTKR